MNILYNLFVDPQVIFASILNGITANKKDDNTIVVRYIRPSIPPQLKDYFSSGTQQTIGSYHVSSSGVIHGAFLSSYLFTGYLGDLSTDPPVLIITCVDDVVPCQSNSSLSESESL